MIYTVHRNQHEYAACLSTRSMEHAFDYAHDQTGYAVRCWSNDRRRLISTYVACLGQLIQIPEHGYDA